MDKLIILFVISFASAATHTPKVHETPNEQIQSIRTVRTPNDHLPPVKVHKPPVFNFQTATQQDPQKNRYVLQQQADMMNLHRRKARFSGDEPRENKLKVEVNSGEEVTDDWIPISTEVARKLPSSSNWVRTNRKLRPYSYYQKELEVESELTHFKKSSINRLDGAQPQYIYIKPNILKNNFGIEGKDAQKILRNSQPETMTKNERNYAILSDLIGKNPTVQLEGLKKLLEGPNANHIFPVVRGPQPFKSHIAVAAPVQEPQQEESVINQVNPIQAIQNTNSKPILEALQAQLDATSKEQANSVLAQAHQQALAHVEAQHQAIAFAAEQAKNEALAKIAAQNAAYDKPQALALTGNVPQKLPQVVVPSVQAVSPQNYIDQDTYATTSQAPAAHVVYAVSATPTTFVVSTPRPQQIPTKSTVVKHQRLQLPQSFSSKVILSTPKPHIQQYAPNHQHHQVLALLQAEKVVKDQVREQNKAILQSQASKQQQTQIHKPHLNLEEDNADVQVHQTLHHIVRPQKPSHHEVLLDTEQHKSENHIYAKNNAEDQDYDSELQYAAKYAFGYRIRDNKMGNDFGHEEKRDGKMAKGQYHVLLPDGRVQSVEYYADDSGYHAKVSYQNLGHH